MTLCVEGASLDQECFMEGTNPTGKQFKDLWSILDTDGNKKLSMEEFKHFYGQMDLDKDTIVNRLEVGAWFKRNEYIICRPWRSQVI